MRKIHNEWLDYRFELSERPIRVVSLVSSATEAMDKMGLHDRLVGISEYCPRYIDPTGIPIVSQYLNADIETIVNLEPDLVLLTTGIQRGLSKKLVQADLPVYNLTLPHSFSGVLENITNLGGLLNELGLARDLVSQMEQAHHKLSTQHPCAKRPRVYVELWLGRHRRAVGGLSYIRDIIHMAGGEMVYGDTTEGYLQNDFEEVKALDPDVFLFFHEPEYLVDGHALVAERGWDAAKPVIMSSVEMGMNVIQDGPSMIDTAHWLRRQLREVGICVG
ncbi:helical backbone metal receptor [Rubritalea marina]|uniref:helical backbone metal receptor n=1 Tax=Rubritalea marina TaxID=361055 RepID=UPI00036B9EC5|nr:helical backbone metal receptor [Rubritalea marina]